MKYQVRIGYNNETVEKPAQPSLQAAFSQLHHEYVAACTYGTEQHTARRDGNLRFIEIRILGADT